jgi:ABC-type antimicrobial peptide transport system permease subunit
MLGVVIGVAAIVALTSIVDGASQGINKSLATPSASKMPKLWQRLKAYL